MNEKLSSIPRSYAVRRVALHSPEFLADCQRVLKGTGFGLWRRGRNANRKQFAGIEQTVKTHGREFTYAYSLPMLHQTLPLRFASYVSLYVRRTSGRRFDNWQHEAHALNRAAGRVEAVAAIYNIHAKAF